MLINQTHHGKRIGARQTRALRFGFTLIELLVVISIIALIAGLLIGGLNRASKNARRSASQRSAAAIAQAVDQFRNEFGFLPPLVHDGKGVSGDNDTYRPSLADGTVAGDGPVFEQTGGSYTFRTVVVWSEGLDFNFFRRRTGQGEDPIHYSGGGSSWDDKEGWEDRRYSKYSLAYYLTGVLGKDVDGIRGAGFARPIIDGTYLGVGYPVGASRDRFDPLIDVDRRGVRIANDYVEPNEYPEHLLDDSEPKERDAIYSDYEIYQRDALVSLVDAFGNAFRYYRWEQGRFANGLLVVENQIDLNIPPVLIDPLALAKVGNEPDDIDNVDLTGGNMKLRNARFAIVSAGPDGLFGTESIEVIAKFLGIEVPNGLEAQAKIRQDVWTDNAVEVGN